MDDVTHDSPSLGQIPRKRKADADDPTSQDRQSPEPMAVDPIDGLLPIPRHHQWSGGSDGHISAPFLEESNHPTPTCRSREPKRPKIQVTTTPATGSTPQQRRKGTPCSPQRRGGRSGDSPHGYIESIARSDSPKTRCRHQKASALSTIDLESPYIPSFLPIPNRDTLKELDLEAVLCNPQLRKSFPPYRCPSWGSKKFTTTHASVLIHETRQRPLVQVTICCLTQDFSSARHQVAGSAIRRNFTGPLLPGSWNAVVRASHGTSSVASCRNRSVSAETSALLPPTTQLSSSRISGARRYEQLRGFVTCFQNFWKSSSPSSNRSLPASSILQSDLPRSNPLSINSHRRRATYDRYWTQT